MVEGSIKEKIEIEKEIDREWMKSKGRNRERDK